MQPTSPSAGPADDRMENYFLLMDPDWQPGPDDEVPPIEAVIGVWPLEVDGSVGPFRTNPDYRPKDEDSVTDPVDALLRMAMQGQADADHLQLMLRQSLLDVALNGDGRPLIMKSPDDVPCVVIATSAVQREKVPSPDWRRLDLLALVSVIPDGVDVLFNPGGPVPFRLTGDFMRETVMMSDEEVAAAYGSLRGQSDDGVEVIPWIVGEPDAEVTIEPLPAADQR